MNELLISVQESTAQQLSGLAEAQGISVEQEASLLLDAAVKRAERISAFIMETNRFAASLPPQTTDSVDLIRYDRDNRTGGKGKPYLPL